MSKISGCELIVKEFERAVENLNLFYTEEGFFSGFSAPDKNECVTKIWNHWSAAKAVIEHALHRKLDVTEISILSLCLRFGPVPYPSEVLEETIWQRVWDRDSKEIRRKSPDEVLKVIKAIFVDEIV